MASDAASKLPAPLRPYWGSLRLFFWRPPVAGSLALIAVACMLFCVWFALALLLYFVDRTLGIFWPDRLTSLLEVCLTFLFEIPIHLTFWGGVLTLVLPRLSGLLVPKKRAFDARLDEVLAWLTNERGPDRLDLRGGAATAFLGKPLALHRGLQAQDVADEPNIDASQLRCLRGGDGRFHFSHYRLTAVYLARHHVGHYVCNFDLTTATILSEQATDCHYKDVVALQTFERAWQTQRLPRWWSRCAPLFRHVRLLALAADLFEGLLRLLTRHDRFVDRSFAIILSSGDKLQVPFHVSALRADDAQRGTITDATIRGLRATLSEKRASYVRLAESA